MTWGPWQALRRLSRGAAQTSQLDDDGPLLDDDLLRQIHLLSLASGDALTEWLMGEHDGLRKTQAIEFDDYRHYVPGDDLRLIDWNAYERLGELFVKTSRAPESVTVSLLLDCSRSMDWGRPNKLRYGKRLAAMLGALALLGGDRVRTYALGNGTAVPGSPLEGASALYSLVADLESQRVTGSLGLRHSLEAYAGDVEPRGMVVLISDLLLPAEEMAALPLLGTSGARTAVLHVVDPAEADPPLRGTFELRDRESGDMATVTITAGLRRRYIEQFEAHAQALDALCAANHMHYIRVDTVASPAELLAGVFYHEGVVQA